jgi:hypothetical protein
VHQTKATRKTLRSGGSCGSSWKASVRKIKVKGNGGIHLDLREITQNYWVFKLCPSFGILEYTTFRKLDIFPSSGEGGEDTYFVGTHSSFWNTGRWTNPETSVILSVIHRRQNPSGSIREIGFENERGMGMAQVSQGGFYYSSIKLRVLV